jgi:hypothetical protein
MSTPVELIQQIARSADPADSRTAAMLQRSLEEYTSRRRARVSRLSVTVDGKPEPSLLHALAHPEKAWGVVRLELIDPPPPGPAWDFLRPIRAVELSEDGSVELQQFDGTKLHGIARILLREYSAPSERLARMGNLYPGGRSAAAGLRPLPAFRTFVRTTGVVPFAIAIEAYLPTERVRYEIDLLDSALQLDLRAGRLPPDRRVGRSARFSHGVDTVVARGDLSYPSSRCLEVIAESNGLTMLDIAPLFRGVGESGTPVLDSLVQRGLVAYDHRTATFRPRTEAFLSIGESSGDLEDPLPPSSNPGLRTSVLELLNAAEARATCPLCGKGLSPGHQGLLCAECTAAVGNPDVEPRAR